MFELINQKTYRILFMLGVFATLIATLSVITGVVSPILFSDKLAHALIFFVLSFLLSHWLQSRYGLWSIVALALFGLLIEVIQYYLPWRSFSWRDWFADIFGILLYQIIHTIKWWFIRRRNSKILPTDSSN